MTHAGLPVAPVSRQDSGRRWMRAMVGAILFVLTLRDIANGANRDCSSGRPEILSDLRPAVSGVECFA
jgi:hypothetical protein